MLRLVITLLVALSLAVPSVPGAAEAPVVIPAPALDSPKAAGPTQTAVLAGGCFWGVQGVYQHVRGVKKAVSGYAGGTKDTASYDVVARGGSRHAESVEVVFDPNELSYGEVLQIFFSVVHDPTQLDRQGPDVGPQYRSNIFYADESQRKIAAAYIAQLAQAKSFGRSIVTRIDPLEGFYPAEAYHQDFLLDNPRYPYIVIHDLPKIINLNKIFPARYRDQPVRVKPGN